MRILAGRRKENGKIKVPVEMEINVANRKQIVTDVLPLYSKQV